MISSTQSSAGTSGWAGQLLIIKVICLFWAPKFTCEECRKFRITEKILKRLEFWKGNYIQEFFKEI